MNTEHQKLDRRIQYTRRVIKEAFLELKLTRAYNTITVADLCRVASVSRGAFYQHYRGVGDVLNAVLDDALAQTRDMSGQFCTARDKSLNNDTHVNTSFCEFVRKNQEYRGVFLDDELAGYIVTRFESAMREPFIQKMLGQTTLTQAQLEALFHWQFAGCFAAAKRSIDMSDDEWNGVKAAIDGMIGDGLSAYTKTRT